MFKTTEDKITRQTSRWTELQKLFIKAQDLFVQNHQNLLLKHWSAFSL